jgi:uncharacterized LabA/DUF88 family protein
LKRVAIFCDGSNIYHGLRECFAGQTLDYARLFDRILLNTAGRELFRVYFYQSLPQTEPAAARNQRFVSRLQRIPYVEVRAKKLVAYAGPDGRIAYREKGIDVQLAVDMVSMAYRGLFDVAALVSGDADLVPAVRAVKEAGRHVENYFFGGRAALELLQQADVSVELTTQFLTGALLDLERRGSS